MDKQRWPGLAALALACAISYVAGDANAEQGDITLHTVSLHVGASGLNNLNPGAAYGVTDHVRIGALYNSYRKPSAYVFYIHPLTDRLRLAGGVISGYRYSGGRLYGKTASAVPAIALEYDVTKQLSVVWFGQAFSLEIKY